MRTLAGACLFILLVTAANLAGPLAEYTIIGLLLAAFAGLFGWLLSGGAR